MEGTAIVAAQSKAEKVPPKRCIGVLMVGILSKRNTDTAKKEGRQLNAPLSKAPRSAHAESTPSRAPMGRVLGRLLH